MSVAALERERFGSGRSVSQFFAIPKNLDRLLDLARSFGVASVEPTAALVDVRLAAAGSGLDGLGPADAAVKVLSLSSDILRAARVRELERLETFDSEDRAAHEAELERNIRAIRQRTETSGADSAQTLERVPPEAAPELVAFAATWAKLGPEYGLYPTPQAMGSAGDVRAAINFRLAVLTRELEARLRVEDPPKGLSKLQAEAGKLRLRREAAGLALKAAQDRFRLAATPEAERDAQKAEQDLHVVDGEARGIERRAWRDFAARSL